jgi:hypothetical protein
MKVVHRITQRNFWITVAERALTAAMLLLLAAIIIRALHLG